MALIVNTAEYCHSTTEQLESKIKEKVDPFFADNIDFNDPKEAFLNLLTEAMKSLVSGMLGACAAPFNTMTKLPWSMMESVGDQSKYVTEIYQILLTKTSVVRSTILADKYFKTFSNKLVEYVFFLSFFFVVVVQVH